MFETETVGPCLVRKLKWGVAVGGWGGGAGVGGDHGPTGPLVATLVICDLIFSLFLIVDLSRSTFTSANIISFFSKTERLKTVAFKKINFAF